MSLKEALDEHKRVKLEVVKPLRGKIRSAQRSAQLSL
jgi:hypothetical protein